MLSDAEAQSMIAAGDAAEVEKRVVEAYRELEKRCDVVVCEGTDFTGAAPALDFDLNARLANALDAPVLVVVRGGSADEATAAVKVARESLEQKGCELFGVIVGRVPAEAAASVAGAVTPPSGEPPVYVLVEQPELACPTVGEVASALDAELLFGAAEGLDREVREVRVAAMSVGHFIDDLVDGTLVIVPGDRADILLASLVSTLQPRHPGGRGDRARPPATSRTRQSGNCSRTRRSPSSRCPTAPTRWRPRSTP